MSEPYVGEIRLCGFNFAPEGWAFCNGDLLFIADNTTLFNLIGTTYGGDGQTTFALPDLRGRLPLHQGNEFFFSGLGGAETVTLNTSQLPSHTHTLSGAADAAVSRSPVGSVPAVASREVYGTASTVPLSSHALAPVGGNQPHDNRQPFVCVNFIISLYGVYPTQN